MHIGKATQYYVVKKKDSRKTKSEISAACVFRPHNVSKVLKITKHPEKSSLEGPALTLRVCAANVVFHCPIPLLLRDEAPK